MQEKNISFKTADKQEFHAQLWLPEEKPKAVLCLVHGFGEHIQRYEHVAEFFTKHQIALAGFDLRGHGKTKGKRGIVASYTQLMDDISTYLQKVRSEIPNTPYILYGHSMGGNLALNYFLGHSIEFEGAIITSPWLRLSSPPPSFVVSMAKLIAKVFPNFTVQGKLNEDGLSRNLDIAKTYKSDPYVHGTMGAHLFIGVEETGKNLLEYKHELERPVLLMHGNEDPITSYHASKSFAEQTGDLLAFKTWEQARHELHNEVNQEEVLNYMLEWVESHISVKNI